MPLIYPVIKREISEREPFPLGPGQLRAFLLLTLFVALSLFVGCAEEAVLTVTPSLEEGRYPLNAYCSALVVGSGEVDVEEDYLPNVINCEN
ncbi:MAG: hypothetical protein VYD19_03380, partial [Myxococcota bacterium]|nr:hypothetical protein [Myxococcota bacterium]